ncbi:MAG TPA: hypothetical protein VLJ61_19030 [Pyrinomonadaceae bacterium]|nr:hypothetical protein [Pyrinomonadaceae bacterium]
MLRSNYVLLLLLCLAAAVHGQVNDKLPEYGTLSEVKDARKVYVHSEDLSSRELILKELANDKLLEVVGKPEDAEFFIFYGRSFIDNGYSSFGGVFGGVFGSVTTKSTSEFGEYYVIKRGDKLETGGNRPRILWGKQNLIVVHGNAFFKSKLPAKEVTREFVKELKKAREEKKSDDKKSASGS